MPDYKAQRDRLLVLIKDAQVSSGVCCCGDDMARHRFAEHAPIDLWDHLVESLVKELEQEDAAAPAQAEPVYQAQYHEKHPHAWIDCTKEQYDLYLARGNGKIPVRKLYAAPNR